jgi:hypothetical protein
MQSKNMKKLIRKELQREANLAYNHIPEKYRKYPIVSVGSGMNVHESYLEKKHNIKIICVDPEDKNEDMYGRGTRARKSDYKFVEDLILENENIVGNCVLILFWPLPDYSYYDILSVYNLQPKFIVSLYCLSGASGTENLHRFFYEIDPSLTIRGMKQRVIDPSKQASIRIIKKGEYKLIEKELFSDKFTFDDIKKLWSNCYLSGGELEPLHHYIKDNCKEFMTIVSLERHSEKDDKRKLIIHKLVEKTAKKDEIDMFTFMNFRGFLQQCLKE